MYTCIVCKGVGEVPFECDEDDFFGYHPDVQVCSHCDGNGQVNEDLWYQDKLGQVASFLAYSNIMDLKRHYDENGPEPWAFHAAENMMTENEYTRARVYEETYFIGEEIQKLSYEMKDVLIAWNDYNFELNIQNSKKNQVVVDPVAEDPVVEDIVSEPNYDEIFDGDDLPF